jgi:1,4-alpha-glucan branching enzyme
VKAPLTRMADEPTATPTSRRTPAGPVVFRSAACTGSLVPIFTLTVCLLVGCAALTSGDQQRPFTVVFRFKAPAAKRVSVVGAFNGWDPQAHPLRGPDREGVWTLSLLLPPGRYRYLFVVDGVRWVPDPSAAVSEADGFSGRNSVLIHAR